MKGTTYMDYRPWLLCDDTGTITLTGWAETTASSDTDPDTASTTEHWPTYTICQDRTHYPPDLRNSDSTSRPQPTSTTSTTSTSNTPTSPRYAPYSTANKPRASRSG